MTKKKFLALLERCKVIDQPVLSIETHGPYRKIILNAILQQEAITMREVIHKVDLDSSGGFGRLTALWLKYNKWLDRWYVSKSPRPHLSKHNEWKTTLRASGWDDETIYKHIGHS